MGNVHDSGVGRVVMLQLPAEPRLPSFSSDQTLLVSPLRRCRQPAVADLRPLRSLVQPQGLAPGWGMPTACFTQYDLDSWDQPS